MTSLRISRLPRYFATVVVLAVIVIAFLLLSSSHHPSMFARQSVRLDASLRTGRIVNGSEPWLQPRTRSRSGHMQSAAREEMGEQDTGGLEQVFLQRREVFRQVCRQWRERTGQEVEGSVRNPYLYTPANFSVCTVPKVGATFWKRVFFFLSSDHNKELAGVQSPFDIERSYVHSHGVGSRVNRKGRSVLMGAHRVMFARDPWSRLWSAYVDKFVLPDSWQDYGKKIVEMRLGLGARAARLRQQSEQEREANGSENSTWTFNIPDKLICADDITFAEFLQFVVMGSSNAHWRPVHRVCNPCVYDPQYLGKMETFARDSAYVLKMAGLGHVLGDGQDHGSHVVDEVRILTAYHFMKYADYYGRMSSCLDVLGVGRLLWRAFQLNGYIPLYTLYPASVLASQVSGEGVTIREAQDIVLAQILGAYSSNPLSPSEWSALKRSIMVSAYRSVPSDLLTGIQDIFQLDFDLFQYDRQPADIFGDR